MLAFQSPFFIYSNVCAEYNLDQKSIIHSVEKMNIIIGVPEWNQKVQ